MITDVNIKLDDNTLTEILYVLKPNILFSKCQPKNTKKTVYFYWCQIFSSWNINLINNLSRSIFFSFCMLGNITELQNFPLHKNINLMVRRSNGPIQVKVVQFRNLWCVWCNIFDSVEYSRKISIKSYSERIFHYNCFRMWNQTRWTTLIATSPAKRYPKELFHHYTVTQVSHPLRYPIHIIPV